MPTSLARVLSTICIYLLLAACLPLGQGDAPVEIEPADPTTPVTGPGAVATQTTTSTLAAATASPSATPAVFLTVSEAVIVRRGPQVDFDVIERIPPRRRFPVIGQNGDWWLIELDDGRAGWVYGPVYIVELIGPVSTVPDVPSSATPTPDVAPTCPAPPSSLDDPASAQARAQAALIRYFNLLNAGRYAEGAEIYGGSYRPLQEWNPLVDPADHAGLFHNVCRFNGQQCLRVRQVVEASQASLGEYRFVVEFSTAEGELFVLGPCCGGNATDMPPQSQFEYTVILDCQGRYRVPALPPYVP